MSKKKTYRVAHVWGEEQTCVTKREFKTHAELTAYLDGIEDADGWLGSASVEDVVDDDYAIDTLANNQGQTPAKTKKELRAIVKWLKEGDNYEE